MNKLCLVSKAGTWGAAGTTCQPRHCHAGSELEIVCPCVWKGKLGWRMNV